MGMMIKIADDCCGSVSVNGVINKSVSGLDKEKLREGICLASAIFEQSGVDPSSIYTLGLIRGPHPGGTAAIGDVVNNELETTIKNLFICDNSVLPQAPGLPPLLTIIALGKRLANQIMSH
jgi:choline dehydrogenase-like flavoprotein